MGLIRSLEIVFNRFKTNGTFKGFDTFSSGHINDTYLIVTNTGSEYVLKKLNGNIFKKPIDVIHNKVKITRFLSEKNIKTIRFIPTMQNKFHVKDGNNVWSLSEFIKDSQTFLRATSEDIANQAGLVTGEFLAQTSYFKNELIEILPDFHSMSSRFQKFRSALKNTSFQRKENAKQWIDFAVAKEKKMMIIENAIRQKKILLRITHNDMKISNILFDSDKKAVCLIDLDTVMTGCVHFDYGDALRTICNTVKEDETDVSKVNFRLDYFKSYTKGFLTKILNHISNEEINYLPKSISVMTFIIGLRFLTDYLNNDTYYKVKHPQHNLERAINQFTLVSKIQEQQQEINLYFEKLLQLS